MGPIRMLTVIDGSSLSNQVNTMAQNVWNKVDHPNAENIFVIDVRDGAGNASLAQQMGIAVFPTVVFAEVQPGGDAILTITGLQGATTEAQIKEIYLQILNGTFVPSNGSGSNGNGTPIIKGEGEETQLGLFGFGLGWVPPNLWLALAIVGAYKSATAKSTTGMALWGAKGIGCTIQYIKSKEAA